MSFFEVQKLKFKYELEWVLYDISFKGKKGELLAIVGPSGCGKTTLLQLIAGILTPHNGSVFLDQIEVTQQPIEKRHIGYVPQNQGLFPHLTVYENIAFGLKAQKWRKIDIENRVNELTTLGGLSEMLHRRPHELSGGQQQRVALLRALAPSPKLLLLDEPLSNIDSQLREQLAMYIRTIQRLSCITTLFVTHDLNEAKMLADKVIILKEGKLIRIGTPMEISMKPGSIEAARSLGLKNLFEIQSITPLKEKASLVLTTELGQFEIKENELGEMDLDARGLYIDPTILNVSKETDDTTNSLSGEIIAIIPEPMLKISTLLLNVSSQPSKTETKGKNLNSGQLKIFRVQIPLERTEFSVSERVTVIIPTKALKLFK